MRVYNVISNSINYFLHTYVLLIYRHLHIVSLLCSSQESIAIKCHTRALCTKARTLTPLCCPGTERETGQFGVNGNSGPQAICCDFVDTFRVVVVQSESFVIIGLWRASLRDISGIHL